MSTEFTKVKLSKHKTVYVEYTETLDKDGETVTITGDKELSSIAHQDLCDLFGDLRPHLAILAEQVEASQLTKLKKMKPDAVDSIVDAYTITTITLEKTGQGVTISGNKKLKTEKVLNLNTPFQKYDDSYEHSGALKIIVDAILHETGEYLNGKAAPSNQTKMDFDNPNGTADGEEL
jgi:hypothetical protein